jgi:phage terminase large subunit-like protein
VTNIESIDGYARAVVDGDIPAGKYHRRACLRHLEDRDREQAGTFAWTFHEPSIDRIITYFSRLKHYKGEWAGQPIALAAWQQFIEGSLAGWVDPLTGLRRIRQAYVEVPRKNGKTLIGGGNANYFTFLDNEPGAEGYCGAVKRDQAKIAFNDAKKLVQSSGLKSRIQVRVGNLHRADTESKLEPLGADYDSTDGLNVHFVLIDEYHAHTTRGLVDVLETAMAARRQPLMLKITTAGNDPVSPCGDEHDYACKILDGVIADDTYFAFIAHADPEDDWLDEKTWAKANPNYGVSVKVDDMRALATKAKNMPAAAATFKQKRLNLWVNADAPWLSLDGWRRGQTIWSEDDLRGRACFIGIDLSSKIDLTAVVLLFPPDETTDDVTWRIIPWCLTPEDSLVERAHRDRAPYETWVRQGFLRTNPGNRIDQDAVRELVQLAADRYDVQQIGVDPWNAGNLMKDLGETDGYPVIEVPQNLAQMSAPSKDFEADVLDALVDAGGHPLMGWCISNAVVQRDNKDNIYPTKKRSRGRIDPVVAALIARKLAAVGDDGPPDDPVLVTI